jgi:hypothetical protein
VLEFGFSTATTHRTRRLKATAHGGGDGRLPRFGEVTVLVSGSP